MILAIDMGNTNTVAGGIDEQKTYFIERITTDQSRTDTEYAISFKNILEMNQISASSIEGAILSSVVPPLSNTILNAVEKVVGIRPFLVGAGMKTGLNILMDNPKAVGSDQIVDAVAASHEHPLPLIVIDMGTATTLCTVDKKGNYIGGVILPGLKVSLDSLSGKTAQLPYISLEVPDRIIGKNTIDCMRAGIIYGTVDMIDGILDRMEAELGESPTIISTGGLARFITPLCRHKIHYDDALLLKGLLILYRKNAPQALSFS